MKQRFSLSVKLFFVALFSFSVMVDASPQQNTNKKLAGYEITNVEKVTVENGYRGGYQK